METNKENTSTTTNDLLMLILNKLKHTEDKQTELKEQLELQQSKHNQQILSIIQKDNSIKNDISFKSDLGIDLEEFDKMIISAKNGLAAASTSNTWRKRINWYNRIFGKSIHEEETDVVLSNILHHVIQPTNNEKASTKRSLLINFYAILNALGRSDEISPQIDKRRIEIHKIIRKQEDKERAQGLCKGWIAFSNLDFRHMFNCISRLGDLPLDKLQVLLLLLLGKVTGRRSGELMWIASSSWKLKFHKVDDEVSLPLLTFQYCFQKKNGPGIYTASFMEYAEDSGEVPPVALTLLVLEKKKIVPNALEAYTNTQKTLDIDENIFESAQDLHQLLCEEQNKFRDKNISFICSTAKNNGNHQKFYDSLLSQVRTTSSKVPMWTTFVHGRQTSLRFDRSAPTVIEFGKFCYYTPSPSLSFGGTCARKGFKQDSVNTLSTNFNQESHLLNSMGHSQKISNKHYSDQDGYNRVIPQNILQNGIDTKSAMFLIAKQNVSPAYENENFFNQDKTPYIDPIMKPLLLLQKYSKAEDSYISECFGDGCSMSFMYEGDWRKHMSSCDSNIWISCGWCNSKHKFNTFRKLSKHLSCECKKKPAVILNNKPVMAEKDFNCECGKSFIAAKGLARHKRDYCKKNKRQKTC
jgi:hypothetical protein